MGEIVSDAEMHAHGGMREKGLSYSGHGKTEYVYVVEAMAVDNV